MTININEVPTSIQTVSGDDLVAQVEAARDQAVAHSGLPGASASDFRLERAIVIWCGDSTTEQAGGNGYADLVFRGYRKAGAALDGVAGTINFGGSGYTINGFVNDAADGSFVGPSIGAEVGAGSWDSWFHKPAGAVSQKTAIAWRNAHQHRALWVVCYGINDVILYSAVGNLTQDEIANYIADRLDTAVKAFLTNNAQDFVVLRVPNPMTARPFPNTGFPSSTAYPAFGTDDATDRALVEKWNQGLRAAYLAVAGRYDRTALWDTWKTVFGKSNTAALVSELPMMGDLVHPSGTGYQMLAHEFVRLMTGSAAVSGSMKRGELSNSTSPWLADPTYLRDNPEFALKVKTNIVAIGSNYIDLAVGVTKFQSAVDPKKPIWVDIDGYGTQKFASFTAVASGGNTRLTGVAPNADLQAALSAVTAVRVYQDGLNLIAGDVYVTAQTRSGYRAIYPGAIHSAGSGYIRVQFSDIVSRPFCFFDGGLSLGFLVVGGDVQTTIDLSDGWSEVQLTDPKIRQFNKTGDWSSYVNQPCAVAVSKALPYESAVVTGTTSATAGTVTTHAHGLGYTPRRVVITPKSGSVVYYTSADATNISVASNGNSVAFEAYVS